MISCVRVSVDQFSHDQRCLESQDEILHGSIIRAISPKLLSGYGFLRPAYLLLIRTGPGECYGTYESTIRLVSICAFSLLTIYLNDHGTYVWYLLYARLLISTQNSNFVNTVKCIISLVHHHDSFLPTDYYLDRCHFYPTLLEVPTIFPDMNG